MKDSKMQVVPAMSLLLIAPWVIDTIDALQVFEP